MVRGLPPQAFLRINRTVHVHDDRYLDVNVWRRPVYFSAADEPERDGRSVCEGDLRYDDKYRGSPLLCEIVDNQLGDLRRDFPLVTYPRPASEY